MASRDNDSSLVTFLFGAAIGAALGVLFAPKAGEETREDLADWLEKRRELGEELLAKVREEFPEKSKAAKELLKRALHEKLQGHNGGEAALPEEPT